MATKKKAAKPAAKKAANKTAPKKSPAGKQVKYVYTWGDGKADGQKKEVLVHSAQQFRLRQTR